MEEPLGLQCPEFANSHIGIQLGLSFVRTHCLASGAMDCSQGGDADCAPFSFCWLAQLGWLQPLLSSAAIFSRILEVPLLRQEILSAVMNLVAAVNCLLAIMAFLVLADTISATLLGFIVYHFGKRQTEDNVHSVDDQSTCPRVLVQLPMYNERQVYKRIIAAACLLDWPSDSLLIQILDDSTDADISAGVQQEVARWQKTGCDVRYKKRKERKGFKAGNLREGLLEPYATGCDFVAILDADFEPAPDWLKLTVPHLQADPELALVQTRWTFSNEKECLLSLWQGIELRWHFLAEQLSGSLLMAYFGFNGTAGVWRLGAVQQAGGWSGDTVTEDMDMAVSAAGLGWKFKMLPHVECLSELPSTVSAYRKQQQRWTCGPAALLRKHLPSILLSKTMGWPRKVYMLAVYIGLRRIVRPIATAASWTLLAASFLWPDVVAAPYWSLTALALLHPLCYFAFSRRCILHYPGCALFISALSLLRVQSVFAGLCALPSSLSWTVTEKLGRTPSTSLVAPLPLNPEILDPKTLDLQTLDSKTLNPGCPNPSTSIFNTHIPNSAVLKSQNSRPSDSVVSNFASVDLGTLSETHKPKRSIMEGLFSELLDPKDPDLEKSEMETLESVDLMVEQVSGTASTIQSSSTQTQQFFGPTARMLLQQGRRKQGRWCVEEVAVGSLLLMVAISNFVLRDGKSVGNSVAQNGNSGSCVWTLLLCSQGASLIALGLGAIGLTED